MKYFQPSYVRVAQKMSVRALNSRLGEYQAAFRFCLRMHAHTDGSYQSITLAHNTDFHEENLKNAMQHVEEIFDTLDISSRGDYETHRHLIQEWFNQTVYRDGVEFVCLHDMWYERHWKKVSLKTPLSNCAVLFWRDYCRDNPDALGLAIALDGKKVQTLQYGRGMENQSKKITGTAAKFLRHMKDKDDPAELMRRDERLKTIDDQFTRERTEMINKCAAEILTHSRYVTILSPIDINDAEYYARMGVPVLVNFLRLVAVMVRNEKNPVELNEYDVRPILAAFEQNGRMRTDIASAISKSIVPYAKARKTVK